jgi:hypothetical protein
VDQLVFIESLAGSYLLGVFLQDALDLDQGLPRSPLMVRVPFAIGSLTPAGIADGFLERAALVSFRVG